MCTIFGARLRMELATYKKFHRRMSNLAFRVRAVADADQRVSIAARELDGPAVGGGQRLDDAVSDAF